MTTKNFLKPGRSWIYIDDIETKWDLEFIYEVAEKMGYKQYSIDDMWNVIASQRSHQSENKKYNLVLNSHGHFNCTDADLDPEYKIDMSGIVTYLEKIDENKTSYWNGKGIPPLNSLVQVTVFTSKDEPESVVGEVLKHQDGMAAIMLIDSHDLLWKRWKDIYPVESEEDQAVRTMLNAVRLADKGGLMTIDDDDSFARAIYRAGLFKKPEVMK